MLRSMTAFARQESSGEWGTAVWELRSVNARFLDMSLRLPEDLRPLEPQVRERVSGRIRRGKVECSLRYQPKIDGVHGFSLDTALAKRVVAASDNIAEYMPNPAPVPPLDILRWPGVIESERPDLDAVGEGVLGALDRSLEDLVQMRSNEGAKLCALVLDRCTEVTAIVDGVHAELPAILNEARERLQGRLAEMKAELDPSRLEQEMVMLAQKMDVAEEMDRLKTHVEEVRRVVKQDEPVGRRLDFLMQELNREANTLGSKSTATSVTRASVDLKVLIEQMREQVQNVE